MSIDRGSRIAALALGTGILALALSSGTRASDDIQWKQIGPGGGGNIFSTAVSPEDPNIVISGSDVGGIFRSGDGGQTWSVRNNACVDPERFASYGMYGNVEFDWTRPSNVVYKGAMKSTDAGLTWRTNIDESDLTAFGSSIDPTNHSIVYAFGYANVYRSSDGFESTSCEGSCQATANPVPACPNCCAAKSRCYQQSCLPAAGTGGTSAPGCKNYVDWINALVIDPLAPTQLLACHKSGLYESQNSAATWTQISPGSLPFQSCQSLVLNYDPASGTRTLYLLESTSPVKGAASTWIDIDSWRGGVYKSTDWGTSWSAANGVDEANILTNPGFETAGDASHPAAGWSRSGGAAQSTTRDCAVSHSGACSIKIAYDNPANGGEVTPDPLLAVQGGELFTLSAWYKTSSATGYPVNGGAFFYDAQQHPLTFPGGSGSWVSPFFVGASTPTTFDWRRFEGKFRVPDAARYVSVRFAATYGGGTSWVDDVVVARSHTLMKTNSPGGAPWFVDYYDLAVDPTDAKTVYVGSSRGTCAGSERTDCDGVWKTTDGGTRWTLTTRSSLWHDNVLDSVVPACGDGVCGGKWETCNTCPVDCTGPGKPAAPACCGDAVCESSTETYNNCLTDCPFDPDPNHGPGYEVESSARTNGENTLWTWSIGIGSGELGHQTVYAGPEHLKSSNGGTTWTELSTMPYDGADSQPGTAQARGATNDVGTYAVVTDNRVPGRDWLFYGDTDNFLQVSYNGGKSFALEGWQWLPYYHYPNTQNPGVVGDAASSIVLDPINPNRIYVGVNVQAGDSQGGSDPNNVCCGGVVQGDFTPGTFPAVGRWSWTPLGDQSTFPKGFGGTELIRTSSGTFFAAVFGRGVFKLVGNTWINTCAGGDWPNSCTGNSWNPIPLGWMTFRLIEEPTSGRLYVSAGHLVNGPSISGETGVWESSDSGASWHRISDPASNTDTGMDREPVLDIASNGPNTLFIATGFGYQQSCTTDPCPIWDGDGGLYKGIRDGSGSWTWAKVLKQPIVSGVTVSPASSTILYAYAGQVGYSGKWPGQRAGIYKSVDGGNHWSLLVNNGLMNLRHGKLYFSSINSHKLYASTFGDGVFEGTISCGPVAEGFPDGDGNGIPDCYEPCTDTACAAFGGDADADCVCNSNDNCPTLANFNQLDGDSDLVGNVCDNCVTVANARPATWTFATQSATYLTSNPWATLTGGQRDDDHDGYGNKCDADFTTRGALVGVADLKQFRASTNKNRASDQCGTNGTQPCARYDLDQVFTVIGTADLTVFGELSNKLAGPKCPTCPLACTAGTAGSCSLTFSP